MSYRKNQVCRKAIVISCATLVLIACVLSLSCTKKSLTEGRQLYLVGVGPGDPELASVRAMKIIDESDIIVCYKKVRERFKKYIQNKEIIEAPHQLFRFYGEDESKIEKDQHAHFAEITAKRDKLISRLRKELQEGKIIAVLDYGDPLIYGPWVWVLEEFKDLDPEVIPGISSFNAANAAIKKSPTLTLDTKSVILTAKDWPGKKDTIEKISAHNTSMVIFTMKAEFDFFIQELLKKYPPKTPVAIVICAGFKDKQKVITGTLANIKKKISNVNLPFEYLIYVGEFINYNQKKT